MTVSGLISLSGAYVSVIPVAAHEAEHTGTSGTNVIVGVVFVTLLSILAGVAAISTKNSLQFLTRFSITNWIVGVLLVTIGATAGRSVMIDQHMTGVIGIAVGAGIGVVTALRGSCGLCAEVTVGAIAVHRVAEGLAIAALSVAGTTISLVGILTLSGHTVAECIAIGSNSNLERKQAIGAITGVSIVFVLATIIGASSFTTTDIIPIHWIVAITAGLLLSLGLSEFHSQCATLTAS